MRRSLKVALVASICTTSIYASGYRIPESSIASIAKAGANFSSANGADANYYNPANMSFMDNKNYFEGTMTLIHLTSMKYTDATSNALDSSSKKENFLAPSLHYVSPFFADDFRFGVSFVAPGGLAKRWDDTYAKAYAKKFELKILELNPTVSYKIDDGLSIALGGRMTYIDGDVESDGGGAKTRTLSGDSYDFGYNVALAYKPIKPLTLAATYRSKVDLTLEGDATLAKGAYDGGASITIPLPAVLDLSASYDFGKTTVEFTYERTYWSKYKSLDFDYDNDLTATPLAVFDKPAIKNWDDVNAYRLGVSHELSDKLTLMAGFAYDEAPASSEHLSFELPDSDAKIYSLGGLYKIDRDLTLGFAYLYDTKKKRSVNNRTNQADPSTGINGTFKDAAAHLVSLSVLYEF